MILTALALDLDENREIAGGLAIPRSERLEELKTVGFGTDGNLDTGTISGGSLVGVLAGVKATGGKLLASRVGEPERLAIGTSESICDGVEGEVSSESHGGDEIRGGDEGVSSGVSVVTASEVTVV